MKLNPDFVCIKKININIIKRLTGLGIFIEFCGIFEKSLNVLVLRKHCECGLFVSLKDVLFVVVVEQCLLRLLL